MHPAESEAATAEFEAAVKASTVPPDAHFGLGYLYWKQQRYEDACREFEAELATQPQHAQALAYLGDAEMHADRGEAGRNASSTRAGRWTRTSARPPGSGYRSRRRARFRRSRPPFSRGDPDRPVQARCTLPFGPAVEFAGPRAGGAGRVRKGEEVGRRGTPATAPPASRAAAPVNLSAAYRLRVCDGRRRRVCNRVRAEWHSVTVSPEPVTR